MAGSYVVILRNVIMAGVAGGVLSDLRFVQFVVSMFRWRDARTL
jgi:hypothetical protein